MTKATLIFNARLLDETMDTPGAILIVEDSIRAVFQGYFTSQETASTLAHSVLSEDGRDNDCKLELYDAKGLTVTPSFIDMHVHMRYPGQTQKEDLQSGLHAAAAGGFGTVVAMPNTNPVVSSMEMALQIESEAAAIGLTNLFQTVSITKDFAGSDTSQLDEIDRHYIPVISEDGKDVISSAVMLEGMKKAAAKGLIVSCHCEDLALGAQAKPFRQNALNIMKAIGLSAWGTSDENYNPDEVETAAIEQIDLNLTKANDLLRLAEDTATARNILLAKQAGCHIHICHASTCNVIDQIYNAKLDMQNEELTGEGFVITAEATPHHIALAGTEEPLIRALVNPPLRDEEDREMLIEALRDGTIDVISTDHAPHTMEDKAEGSPGFTGLETAYAICNTVLVKQNNFAPQKLSQLMSANPARILGLTKGLLKSGYTADLTLVDPEEEWVVDSRMFCSKGKATPFEGKELTGKVKGLFLAGRKVFER
ncbi:MAG: dihydroorotase [Treponema sp.]|nr:dihydroorotase [Treponema sp.]